MILVIITSILAAFPPLVWMAEGRAEAERDIASATMKWKIYGRMAGLRATDDAARVKLRERFGIELIAVAQCVVTDELVQGAEGYNDRIREEVEREHGAGAIDQVWKEARQESRFENVALGWLWKFFVVAGGLWVCRRILMRVRG